MPTNFSVRCERLAQACRARNLKSDKLCRSIGLGARRVIDLEYSGLKVLDIRLPRLRLRWRRDRP